MPTTLPTRHRGRDVGERRTMLTLLAVVCAFVGLALIEPAFTDTSASAEISDLFAEIAAY